MIQIKRYLFSLSLGLLISLFQCRPTQTVLFKKDSYRSMSAEKANKELIKKAMRLSKVKEF